MDVKAEKKESCVVELDVSVPHKEISSSEDEALQHFQKQASLPGFRKGRAPANLVKTRYRDDLKKSVLQQVLWSKISEYIKQENLNTVSDPFVREVNYNIGEDLNFKATLELFPEFDLVEYKSVPVEVEKSDVDPEEEEKAIQDLQEKYSQFKSSETGTIRQDDFAIIDYELTIDDKSLEKKEATWVKVTDQAYIKDFILQLIGLKIGDEKDLTAKLPDNYAQEEFAGKEGRFHVKVIDVKERVKPELNDDFAKMVGPYENIDKLKEFIRTNLQDYKKQQSRYSIENQVSDFLLKNTQMDLPPTLLLQEEQNYLKETLQRMQYSGLKQEDMKERIPEITKDVKEKAKERLIIHFVLEKIIEKENFTVSDEDISQEYDRMSKSYQMPLDQVKERYQSDEAMAGLKSRICKIKAVDFIVNNVTIKEIEPRKEGQK